MLGSETNFVLWSTGEIIALVVILVGIIIGFLSLKRTREGLHKSVRLILFALILFAIAKLVRIFLKVIISQSFFEIILMVLNVAIVFFLVFGLWKLLDLIRLVNGEKKMAKKLIISSKKLKRQKKVAEELKQKVKKLKKK